MSPLISFVEIVVICTIARSAPAPEIIDLGYEMNNRTEFWPGTQRYNITLRTREKNENGLPWFASNTYESNEHAGTHMDAPFHLLEDGWKVADIPLHRFFVPGVLIDVSEKVNNSDFQMTANDIIAWEKEHCTIPRGSVVLIRFGWSSLHYDNHTAYFGLVNDSSSEMHFPGIAKDAAQFIAEKRQVYGVGVDVASLDPGQNVLFEAHRTLFQAKIFGIENLNLKKDVLPATGFRLHIMPMKITEGTGAPCRVIAFLDLRNGEAQPTSCVPGSLGVGYPAE